MSRFDGARQGLGTWAIGLVVTVALASPRAVLGAEYNVLERLELPAARRSAIARERRSLALAVVVAARDRRGGRGQVGERYHRRVDRAGFVD